MKTESNRSLPALRLACATLILAALCANPGGGITGPSIAAAQPDRADDLKALFVPKLPENAKEVSSITPSAKPGDTVIIHGYIPMADGFDASTASFTLVEPTTVNPAKPDFAVSADRQAAIKFVDSQGAPLKEGLDGKFGLKPGAEVFVTGTVDRANGKDTLVVKAESVHVPRAPLPPSFFSAKSPESSTDVSAARKSGGFKVGDEVVLRGRVGGSKEPFVAGRAVFTLMGRALKACNENPDDKCSKPWDYCCETKADIAANSTTIQVVDEKGQVLRTDMKGRRGLKELSEIVVIGKVAVSDGRALVINASSMEIVN